MEPNLSRARQLVLELMAIPGRSGDEEAVASYVRDKLLASGAPADAIKTDNAHVRSPLKGSIGNLILKLPGTVKGARRLLSAHLDTVPICVGCKPKVEGEFVRSSDPSTGLGADNRAGTATILVAALEILEKNLPHPPLTFCWFVQEEVGLHGARYMQQSQFGRPAMGFNWDGGAADKLTVGATGGYRMEITIEGIASHAGIAPEKGVSAIAISALAIADLHRAGWHGLVERGTKRGTTNIGVIHGGEATNVVTERVTIRAEARSHDPKFRERIVREIQRAFHRAAKELRSADGKRGGVNIEGRLDYESFALDGRSECLQIAEAAVSAVGLEPVRAVSNGGLDANWINAHGIPTVSLGCGQMNVHTTAERLDIQAFENACRIALRIATAN